jgi:hypothetical protein
MNDLDERLRRDAAQCKRTDDPVPSLDDLLDAVTAPRRPRHVALWLSVAAAVAAIALVVVFAVRPWSIGHTPAVRPSAPLVRTAIDNIVPLAAVADPGSRTVDIYAPCHFSNLSAVIAPDGPTIRLRLSGVLMLRPPDTGTSYSCTTTPVSVRVHLAAPLGSRRIVCRCSPSDVPVLRRFELPEPGYLPAGYLPAGVEPIRPLANRLVGQRNYSRGSDRILVMVGAEAQMPTAEQPVAGRVVVGNHDAVITDAAGTCVTWVVRPGVSEGVCSVGNPGSNLPTTEVVKVARGLR